MTVLRLIPAVATHRGMRRRHNEDAVGYHYPSDINLLSTHGTLFIVADGVGGLSAGDEASQMTVKELIREYYDRSIESSIEDHLVSAIQAVNTIVFETLNRKGATTLVVVVIHNEQLIAASVGDSQIFHIRNEIIKQLNEEDVLHSNDADNGALTKAIGYRESLDIEAINLDLVADDQILLCSDGLTRYVDQQQLMQLAKFNDPRDSVRRMINTANTHGGADNISALLINMGDAIDLQDIDAHIQKISVRVAVDTDPLVMQDVPSKPNTQIPLARPQSTIDEEIFTQSSQMPSKLSIAPTPNVNPMPQQQNQLLIFIIAGIIILTIGAGILGVAFASLRNTVQSDNPIQEVLPDTSITPLNDDNQTENADNLQIGDIIVLDRSIFTKDSMTSDVDSFLTSPDAPYRINNIIEDNEGRLWYRLLEENTAQTGWLAESNLGNYRLQNN